MHELARVQHHANETVEALKWPISVAVRRETYRHGLDLLWRIHNYARGSTERVVRMPAAEDRWAYHAFGESCRRAGYWWPADRQQQAGLVADYAEFFMHVLSRRKIEDHATCNALHAIFTQFTLLAQDSYAQALRERSQRPHGEIRLHAAVGHWPVRPAHED